MDKDTVIAALYNSNIDQTYITIIKQGSRIYPSDTNESLETIIQNELTTDDLRYKERIVEVTTGGRHITADDGTTVTILPGEKRVYIYYTSE